MPSIKKPSSAHKRTTKATKRKSIPLKKGVLSDIGRRILKTRVLARVITSGQDLLRRRPHRSFRRTYRRDYVRSLDMPGYWAFTNYVRKTLWDNKVLIIWLVVVYCLVTVLVSGLASEDTYTQARETISSSGENVFEGAWGEIGKAGLLVATGLTGAFNEVSADTQSTQQVLLTLTGLLTWLTTIWLLRAILAGRRPKLRDGLYNAGAPLLSTFLVALVICLQLLPIAVAIFGYGAAVSSGLLDGGVEAMLFWGVAGLLMLLSLYWLTATLIAFVVVTLPGIYPMQALRTAGDLVVGRRVRILFRLLWMVLILTVVWAFIAIPIVLFDSWIKSILPAIAWLPLVPAMLLMMSALSVVWSASYIYLLYRKIVDDDALPA